MRKQIIKLDPSKAKRTPEGQFVVMHLGEEKIVSNTEVECDVKEEDKDKDHFAGTQGVIASHTTLPPYQERVVVEKSDLDAKITALAAFIDTPMYADVAEDERLRLSSQLEVMEKYSEILGKRIEHF